MRVRVRARYLWLLVVARGAHNVVSGGRREVAHTHAVVARGALLGIVFNLEWGGQPHAFSGCGFIMSPTSVWSVWTVPLLSTGEGSTVAGYGLGGGCRWSDVCAEDLGKAMLVGTAHGCMGGRGRAWNLFEKTWANVPGELGESV